MSEMLNSLFLPHSEKPLPLQILLTDRGSDQSADQLPSRPACPPKPLSTQHEASSEPFSCGAVSQFPKDDTRTISSCGHFQKTLPVQCVNTPPPLAPTLEATEPSTQWKTAPPVIVRAQAPPSTKLQRHTSSPVNSNNTCRLMKTKILDDPSHLAPEDPPPLIDHVEPPSKTTPPLYDCADTSPQTSPPVVRVSGPVMSPPSKQEVLSSSLPSECWLENASRHFVPKNAQLEGETAPPGEGPSELDLLYQASLQAPSMHGERHQLKPQLNKNRPGQKTMHGKLGQRLLLFTQQQFAVSLFFISCVCVCSCVQIPIRIRIRFKNDAGEGETCLQISITCTSGKS